MGARPAGDLGQRLRGDADGDLHAGAAAPVGGEGGLYALFEEAVPGAGAPHGHERSPPTWRGGRPLYKEDCVELFFTPDPAHPRHYYEVELGPFGHFFDIDVDRERGKQDTGWSSAPRIGTRAGTRQGARTATVEVQLAAPEIIAALVPRARRCRSGITTGSRGSPEQRFLAWSRRTAKPNFHVPEAFGGARARCARPALTAASPRESRRGRMRSAG